MKIRLAIALLLLPLLLHAESMRSLVNAGNEAYKAGEFDEALNAYRQAQLEAPDNALGKFNEGAALYRKEDLDGAAEAFRSAALDAKAAGDSRLEAKSLFNLGNSLLKGAESSQKYEPQVSVDKLMQGAAAYQQALGRDPHLTVAAENLQIARSRLSELLKQQAQSQQQPQNSNDLQSQIEEQLRKQQELSEDNRESQQNPSESEQQQQAQRQRDLQQRSEELSKQTPENQQAQEQLKQAAQEQQKAAQQLSQGQPEKAGESQRKAEGHLAQALQQLQQGQQQPEQQQAQSQPSQNPGQDQGQEQSLQALELTPDDILDQERVARQRRQLLQGQQQRPVEKNW